MAHIVGLAEIVLWTTDKAQSVRFYHELLGLPIISPPTLPNVFLKAGDGHAGIPNDRSGAETGGPASPCARLPTPSLGI